MADQSEQWHKVHDVAMWAFINYFNQTALITVEQASEQIKSHLTRFDSQLSET